MIPLSLRKSPRERREIAGSEPQAAGRKGGGSQGFAFNQSLYWRLEDDLAPLALVLIETF